MIAYCLNCNCKLFSSRPLLLPVCSFSIKLCIFQRLIWFWLRLAIINLIKRWQFLVSRARFHRAQILLLLLARVDKRDELYVTKDLTGIVSNMFWSFWQRFFSKNFVKYRLMKQCFCQTKSEKSFMSCRNFWVIGQAEKNEVLVTKKYSHQQTVETSQRWNRKFSLEAETAVDVM